MTDYEVDRIEVAPVMDGSLRGGVRISVDSDGRPFDLNFTAASAEQLIVGIRAALRTNAGPYPCRAHQCLLPKPHTHANRT